MAAKTVWSLEKKNQVLHWRRQAGKRPQHRIVQARAGKRTRRAGRLRTRRHTLLHYSSSSTTYTPCLPVGPTDPAVRPVAAAVGSFSSRPARTGVQRWGLLGGSVWPCASQPNSAASRRLHESIARRPQLPSRSLARPRPRPPAPGGPRAQPS